MIIRSIVGIFNLVKSFIKLVIKGIKELILIIQNAKGLYNNSKRVEKNITIRRNSHNDINNEIF